jgi:hypothetical protein
VMYFLNGSGIDENGVFKFRLNFGNVKKIPHEFKICRIEKLTISKKLCVLLPNILQINRSFVRRLYEENYKVIVKKLTHLINFGRDTVDSCLERTDRL